MMSACRIFDLFPVAFFAQEAPAPAVVAEERVGHFYELSLLFAGSVSLFSAGCMGDAWLPSASVSSHLSNRSVHAPCRSFSTRTFGSPASQHTHTSNDSRVIDAVRAAHAALCAAARAQPRCMGSDPRRTRTLHGPFAGSCARLSGSRRCLARALAPFAARRAKRCEHAILYVVRGMRALHAVRSDRKHPSATPCFPPGPCG